MFNSEIVSLEDIQFVLIFTFCLYLYYRKKRITFITVALTGYISLFIGIFFELQKGIKAAVLLLGLVVAFIFSYKELESLGKEGIDAKGFLKPEVLDFVVLILFFIIWTIIKVSY